MFVAASVPLRQQIVGSQLVSLAVRFTYPIQFSHNRPPHHPTTDMNKFLHRTRRQVAAMSVLGAALLLTASAFASAPIPGNVGNGLEVLLQDRLVNYKAPKPGKTKRKLAVQDSVLNEQAQATRDYAFVNEASQIKVYIHLSRKGGKKADVTSFLPATASVTGVERTYQNGVIEAWVDLDDVTALAQNKKVSSVILAVRPENNVGAATSQGVVQHRVDQITQNGTGITIGAMSDSFDRSASTTDGYVVDQGTGDLPGPSNTVGNTLPVAVLDDTLAGTDEGRAMLQLIHDMAPKAKLGFATASAGQVSFANNIRSLAGLASGTNAQAGFAADVIVDDLSYFDSPYFGTSLVGRAVNEVAAAGVSYFSSAGNRNTSQAYFSTFRPVSGTNLAAATAGTNLNFAGVDPSLYAGGFHNFRTDGGQDIAQSISQGVTTSAASITFQWDDPYDVNPPTFNPTPFLTASGTATSTTTSSDVTVPNLTAGQQYRFTVTATAGSGLDAVVTIVDPNGTIVTTQDTGTDEEIFFFASVAGTYTVRTVAFDAGSTGAYTFNAYLASGTLRVTSDFNLLFFRQDTGAFVKSLSAKNLQTNQPIELGSAFTAAGPQLQQLVICRANIPTGPNPATLLRYQMTAVARPVEYFDYLTPLVFGHNHEPGCMATAAYSPFRPYLPEDFTSAGPSTILFDVNANRLPAPIIRLKPDLAGMDGANNTFFGGDSTSDVDALPNFYGTSAAAPHAAAVAALVLQAKGGPKSVTQPQMRTILQSTAFPHDLDPYTATASIRTSNGGKLTIVAKAANGNFNDSDGRSVTTSDVNSFAVSYVGAGSVSALSINVQNGNPNGGSDLGPQPGLVWDSRALSTAATSGFPFTVGSRTGGLAAATITGTYSQQAPAPAVAGQFYQLDIAFPAASFTGGSSFTFGADRDELRTPVVTTATTGFGTGADLLGRTVAIPSGALAAGGATVTGTLSDGSTFSGTFVNRIGKGYSAVDGFGFLNAQDAVAAPIPAQ